MLERRVTDERGHRSGRHGPPVVEEDEVVAYSIGVPVARYFVHDVFEVPFRDRSATGIRRKLTERAPVE